MRSAAGQNISADSSEEFNSEEEEMESVARVAAAHNASVFAAWNWSASSQSAGIPAAPQGQSSTKTDSTIFAGIPAVHQSVSSAWPVDETEEERIQREADENALAARTFTPHCSAEIPGGFVEQYARSDTRTHLCVQHNSWYGIECEHCEQFPSLHFRDQHYGFESGGCIDGIHGMFPDTCDECRSFVDKEMAEFAARPLHVVLTGTFPQLGGGSGLKVGKDKLTMLVQSTNYGKVVSALSCKVTHLVTGNQPGAAKVKQASQSYGYCLVVTYDEFLPILQEKLRNPPRLPTRKEKAAKRLADVQLKADCEKRVKARLDNEQLFIGYVHSAAAAVSQTSSASATDAVNPTTHADPIAAASATDAVIPTTRPRSDESPPLFQTLQMEVN
jgi:hypothetical protein